VSQELLKKASEASMKKEIPTFHIGDTVKVHCRIVEGDKERIQMFIGTVIARRGSGTSETFIVRRIVNNEGVERTFPLHSPKVVDIEVIRHGKVRRAKLYYLRERVGKSTRLREIRAISKAGDEAASVEGQGSGAEETTPVETLVESEEIQPASEKDKA
jgi:large subunit ribosomal protein L19